MTSRISFSNNHENPVVNSAENAHEKAAGFFTRQRELARQRLWPIALTFLSWLLYHVVCIATALNFAMINAESAHMTPVERTRELRDALTGLLGTGSFSWFMLTVPLAAVLAIEGFAWMDNRQKVDFYESLPLARGVRFRDICTSSFLYFVFSYVITLEIGLAIAGAMGALSHTLLAEVLQQAINTIALFVSVYALGVLSAMLTGNVIIACLAFGVLLLYETLFRLLLEGYCNAFLAAWDSEFSYFPRRNIFSPVYHYLSRDGLVKTPAELLALAALFFLLARICYRLRRNECAGTAVVFGPVRSVVRIAMAVMVGLTTGLIFSSIGVLRGNIIAMIWLILFTVIAACIMQIIYEFDFRALFHRPLEIAAALALALLIYLAFLFDVAGYDRYIPDPGKVADAALISREDDEYSLMCTDEGEPVRSRYGELYMHLDNVEDVTALARYGQAYTRRVKTMRGSAASGASDTSISADPETAAQAGGAADPELDREQFQFLVLYRMKNGTTISRAFSLPSTVDPAMMDAVTATPQYREGAFGIYHDRAIMASADSFILSSTNGKDWKSLQLNADLYRDFRQAYQKDLEQFSYSFARASRPFARISLDYHGASGRKALYPNLEGCTFSCPVYASFTNTIRFLQESGVWTEPYNYDSLPDLSDYESLSAEDRDLLDTLDLTVFTGPFHHSH